MSSSSSDDEFIEITNITKEDFSSGLSIGEIVDKHVKEGNFKTVKGSFKEISLTPEDLKPGMTIQQIVDRHNIEDNSEEDSSYDSSDERIAKELSDRSFMNTSFSPYFMT